MLRATTKSSVRDTPPISTVTRRTWPGLEPSTPGLMSANSRGALAPASSTHSSRPCSRSCALKNRRLPTTLKFVGVPLHWPGQRSANRRVPAGVPSVTHSSLPSSKLAVVKNWRPSKLADSPSPPPWASFNPVN